jgi:hypothetical protein
MLMASAGRNRPRSPPTSTCSELTIRRRLAELEQIGRVTTTRPNPTGHNVYQLHFIVGDDGANAPQPTEQAPFSPERSSVQPCTVERSAVYAPSEGAQNGEAHP